MISAALKAVLFCAFSLFLLASPQRAEALSDSAYQAALKKMRVDRLSYKPGGKNQLKVDLDIDVPSVFELPFEVGRVEFKNPAHISSGPVKGKPHRFWMLGEQKGTNYALVFDRAGRHVMTLETGVIVKNAGFIWASYLVVALLIGALALWIIRDEGQQVQRLAELKGAKS